MQNKYDIVIIGSGLGGLTCAYILSKSGYKVAVFEKGAQIGGCLQTFTRSGVKFDTGVHYIGSMGKGQTLNRLFHYLSLFPDIKISPLDPNGFDVISFRDEQYKFATGYDKFVDTLSQKFPKERKNIKQYTKSIRDVALSSPFHNNSKAGKVSLQFASNYANTSLNDFIDSITDNEVLHNVLVGIMPLYAGVKNKTPLYVHAFIKDSNISGAARIVGGSDQIADSLARSIRSFGGEIFTLNKVKKIICNDTKAVQILLENGNIIATDYIISNVHPEVTINMIDSNLIRPMYRNRICQAEQTISNFTLYLKFKENKVPYMNHNFYHYNNNSTWGCENYDVKNWPPGYMYLHLCPPTQSQYAQAGEVLTVMRYEEVEQWAGTKIEHRGEAYKEFKHRKAEILLAQLERDFPGTIANIESYYTSSPLTYLDYISTKEGGVYGILRDINSPRILHRTRIPNLFLTGQSTNAHGIMGVIIGAIITCSEFLGYDFFGKQIKNMKF